MRVKNGKTHTCNWVNICSSFRNPCLGHLILKILNDLLEILWIHSCHIKNRLIACVATVMNIVALLSWLVSLSLLISRRVAMMLEAFFFEVANDSTLSTSRSFLLEVLGTSLQSTCHWCFSVRHGDGYLYLLLILSNHG